MSYVLSIITCSKCHQEKPRRRNWSCVCSECQRLIDREKYAKHKKDPVWVANNRARAHLYYLENRKEVLEYWKHRHAEFPEIAKERVRSWRHRNPLEFRAQGALRKARTVRATVKNGVDYLAILVRDKLMCQLCLNPISSRQEVSFDHNVPLSKGGEHSTENIQLAHLSCNIKKGDS